MNDLRHDPEEATVRGQFTRLPDLLHGLRIIGAPDLRTADQRHADELAALRAEIDDIKATLRKQAQMVQVLWLAHELRERTL